MLAVQRSNIRPDRHAVVVPGVLVWIDADQVDPDELAPELGLSIWACAPGKCIGISARYQQSLAPRAVAALDLLHY